jgi:hypothetical protein
MFRVIAPLEERWRDPLWKTCSGAEPAIACVFALGVREEVPLETIFQGGAAADEAAGAREAALLTLPPAARSMNNKHLRRWNPRISDRRETNPGPDSCGWSAEPTP